MKKLWLLVAISFAILVVYVTIYWLRFGSAWQPVVSNVEVHIPALNESVFLRKKLWGISYGHQIIWISSQSNKKLECDQKTDYIYKGSSPLFYLVKDKELEVYTSKASPMPVEFKSGVKIIQIELDNPAIMELLTTYESKGLKKLE